MRVGVRQGRAGVGWGGGKAGTVITKDRAGGVKIGQRGCVPEEGSSSSSSCMRECVLC